MNRKVQVTAESASLTITLNGSELSSQILDELPMETRASTWGDEIYFAVPLDYRSQAPTKDVSAGDVAYWPDGSSLALFYGPTPLSDGEKPMPADDVEIVGTITEGLNDIDQIEAGESLSLTSADAD